MFDLAYTEKPYTAIIKRQIKKNLLVASDHTIGIPKINQQSAYLDIFPLLLPATKVFSIGSFHLGTQH